MMLRAPLIGLSRHRLAVDGRGVTTLVAFHGCPLRCKYCLNERCLRADGIWREVTVEELHEEVRVDHLYFLATSGGITFGGGEPLLQSEFIEAFCQRADSRWNITLETSLNVPRQHLQRLDGRIAHYIVDIKDMNPDIYRSYTGHSPRQAQENLQWLAQHGSHRVTIRLPHIPEYNSREDIRRSREALLPLGFSDFDEFEYVVR